MKLGRKQGVAPPKETPAAEDKEEPVRQPPPGVWVAVSAALAVVVSIFAALGIEEDVLRRMVRNYPEATAGAISLVIVGASTPLVLLLVRTTKGSRRKRGVAAVSVVSAAGVIVGLVAVLWTGAESLNSRDMPGLSLTAVKSQSGAVSITSEATAAALRSRERMLLRIYGVSHSPSQDLAQDCQSPDFPALQVPATGSRVLQWGEAGPDKSGAAKVSETVVIKGDEFSFVCAYAILINDPREESYHALATVDLRSLTFVPSQPKPSASASITRR